MKEFFSDDFWMKFLEGWIETQGDFGSDPDHDFRSRVPGSRNFYEDFERTATALSSSFL